MTNGEMPEAVVLILPGWGLLHLTKVVTGFLELVHNDLTCNLVVLCDWLIKYIYQDLVKPSVDSSFLLKVSVVVIPTVSEDKILDTLD